MIMAAVSSTTILVWILINRDVLRDIQRQISTKEKPLDLTDENAGDEQLKGFDDPYLDKKVIFQGLYYIFFTYYNFSF